MMLHRALEALYPKVQSTVAYQQRNLSLAASCGHTNLISLLLDYAFDPNRGEPIIAALEHGHALTLKLLLERGARPMSAMIKTVNHKLKSINYLGPRSFECKYRVLSYHPAAKVVAPMRQDMTYTTGMARLIGDVEDSLYWRGREKRLMGVDETGEELGVDAFIASL
jgi:hypothetical protein